MEKGTFIYHNALLDRASNASLDHALLDQDRDINVARNICIM